MLYPQGAELAREAEASLQSGDLPGPLAGLVQQYVEHKFAGEDLRGTLYLNAASPLIRSLATPMPPDPPGRAAREAVLTVIWQTARLFSGRMLTAADAVTAFASVSAALSKFLHL
jgi:hypothetical protein